MKFYTGKGDAGKSTLFGSRKVIPKNNKIFEALGALDELNSYLGICKTISKNELVNDIIKKVQENLFTIQAELGSGKKNINEKDLKDLERIIEKLGENVSNIHKFVISGGNLLAAHLDYARTLARKAERKVIPIKLSKTSYAYINRLSSLLFVLSRYINKEAKVIEEHPSY